MNTYMTSYSTPTATRSARRIAARKTKAIKLGTGSTLASKLEKLYKAIQVRHPELPDVVIITGTGLDARGLKLGHFGRDFWKLAQAEGRMGELFIAGETIHFGVERTLQTLLHEAAHVLGAVRDIQNTSKGNAYHNRKFVELAEELGLEWPEGQKPHPTIGFSSVVIKDSTLAEYATELVEFGSELNITMDTLERLGLVIDPKGGDESPKLAPVDPTAKAPRKGADRNNARLTCSCPSPRVIRASKAVLALGAIRCEICGDTFEVR